MAKSVAQEFTKGLWAEIPPFRLVLGLCPTLAVTKTVENGIGMGVATTFVLVCSNIIISLLLVPLIRFSICVPPGETSITGLQGRCDHLGTLNFTFMRTRGA